MFFFLIGVGVTWMVAFAKVCGAVSLNGHYFVCKLNLDKADAENPIFGGTLVDNRPNMDL